MEETYGLEIEVLHGVATYRNYRRFETAARMITPPSDLECQSTSSGPDLRILDW